MADFSLDAMLEIDDSQVDEVNDQLEADVDATGGAPDTEAARQQQESIVAGGVSKGLLAVGAIAGILSQLKIITGVISAVLGAISRALVPIIEDVAEFVRPIVDLANQAQQGRKEAVNVVEEVATGVATLGGSGAAALPLGAGRTFEEPGDVGESVANDPVANAIANFITDPSKGADQSGEAQKQNFFQILEDAGSDVLGALD